MDTRDRDAAEWLIDQVVEEVTDQLQQAPHVQALPIEIRESVHGLLHGAAQASAGHIFRRLVELDVVSVSGLYQRMLQEQRR